MKNEHGWSLPQYWKEGSHFGLYVGLTDLAIPITRDADLRDMCVFLHYARDRISLRKPKPEEFERWCLRYFEAFHRQYPEKTATLTSERDREKIAAALRVEYEASATKAASLRHWTKLAGLVGAVQLVREPRSLELLIEPIRHAARLVAEQSF